MINEDNKKLAINGGNPIRKDKIPIHRPVIEHDDIEIVNEAIQSTFVSGDGPFCRQFENALSEYIGIKHTFFTTNCTAALDMAFMVKNFEPDSEVLIPNYTYTSTALGPILNNLKVTLVDVYDYNGNIDINKIENKINEKTVAIIPVDYAGNPSEIDEINLIAKKHKLYVVHDTAQSIGSLYKNKKTGSLTEVSTFSFHGTKNITTGEGGAFLTNDDDIAEKIKVAREKGTDKWGFITDKTKKGFYEYISIGNSYVQSNILGALGVSQLKKVDKINNKRRQIADYYNNELKNIDGLKLPKLTKDAVTNWHLYFILVEPDKKNWIIDALNAEGITANVHYNPLHMNRYYEHLGSDEEFPNSVKFFNSYVRIPIFFNMTDNDVEDVVIAVKKVFT